MPTPYSEKMTLAETLEALGLTTTMSAFNWIMSAAPPNARLTPEGGWYFVRAEVEAVRSWVTDLRARNDRGDLALADVDDDGPVPLL